MHSIEPVMSSIVAKSICCCALVSVRRTAVTSPAIRAGESSSMPRRSLIGVAPVRARASATSASGCPETKMPSVSFSHVSASIVDGAGSERSVGGECRRGLFQHSEQRTLTQLAVARLACSGIERSVERVEQLRPVTRQRVEGPALDQRFVDLAVRALAIDAFGKIEKVGKLAVAFRARRGSRRPHLPRYP